MHQKKMIKRFLLNLLNWGFFGNRWAWFHIMGGAVCAKIALVPFDKWNALLITILLAILWELFEFVYDGGVDGILGFVEQGKKTRTIIVQVKPL